MSPRYRLYAADTNTIQIAGFFTGGSLAIRGGYKAARNGAISCAILLAVIEGVGIGFQKMFAGTTKLEVSRQDGSDALGSTDTSKAPQPPPSGEQMLA